MLPEPQQATDHLQKLAVELEERRFAVRLRAAGPGRPPRLHVVNPAAPVLAEYVLAAPDCDGRWRYWFSWRQHIAPVNDPIVAAHRIERVLAELGR
jgi:hypothetical protein